MYLSCLLIDAGKDPDRPRPGRLWLRNVYRVHQRLCMGFPSAERQRDDSPFLKPFEPQDFTQSHVHRARNAEAGFLFRIDPQTGGRAVILVQSAQEPNWQYAFHNASHLLAAPPNVKSFDHTCFTKGQTLRFRLVANPTRRLSKRSLGSDGKPVMKGVGKRVPVLNDNLSEWLARRAERQGFSVNEDSVVVQPGYVYVNKKRNGKAQRLRSARYDGRLEVTDSARFQRALVQGIGPAKAYGFGLLSVAPLRRE